MDGKFCYIHSVLWQTCCFNASSICICDLPREKGPNAEKINYLSLILIEKSFFPLLNGVFQKNFEDSLLSKNHCKVRSKLDVSLSRWAEKNVHLHLLTPYAWSCPCAYAGVVLFGQIRLFFVVVSGLIDDAVITSNNYIMILRKWGKIQFTDWMNLPVSEVLLKMDEALLPNRTFSPFPLWFHHNYYLWNCIPNILRRCFKEWESGRGRCDGLVGKFLFVTLKITATSVYSGGTTLWSIRKRRFIQFW